MPSHRIDVDRFQWDLFLLPYGPLAAMVINFACNLSFVCILPRWSPLVKGSSQQIWTSEFKVKRGCQGKTGGGVGKRCYTGGDRETNRCSSNTITQTEGTTYLALQQQPNTLQRKAAGSASFFLLLQSNQCFTMCWTVNRLRCSRKQQWLLCCALHILNIPITISRVQMTSNISKPRDSKCRIRKKVYPANLSSLLNFTITKKRSRNKNKEVLMQAKLIVFP